MRSINFDILAQVGSAVDWDEFEQEALASCDVIEPALGRRFGEFNQVRIAGEAIVIENRRNATDLNAICYGETPFSRTQNYLGLSHATLVYLQHDIEIAVAESFLSNMIDLAAVFPPFEFSLNSHNVVRATQSAPATFRKQSAPQCRTLASSHIALNAPVSVSILGQTANPDLFIPFQLSRASGQPSWQRKFLFQPARGPQLCPPDSVRRLFSGGTIDGRVRVEALGAASRIPPFDIDATFIDELFGPSYLYAGLVADNLAFFGVARHRPRKVLAPLGPLPGWASAGLKFDQSLLQVQVMANAPTGSWLTHFDADPAAQVFRFGIASEKEKSWGGDLVRVVVAVKVTGEFVLSIRPGNPNRLQIDSIQQGALRIERTKVDIEVLNTKIDPPGVDELVDRLATELARALAGDLGNYSTSIDKTIPNCARVDSRILPSALAIFVQQA